MDTDTMTQTCNYDKPNIIVFGVGHSGTTILTKIIHSLGWNVSEDNDPEHFEPRGIRDANDMIVSSGRPPFFLNELLDELDPPWVIKDPRFITTLSCWMPFLKKHNPLMVHVTRNADQIRQSYLSRGEFTGSRQGTRSMTIERAIEKTESMFRSWNGPKIQIKYEDIAEAVSLWRK